MTDKELLELAAKAAGIWDASDPSFGLLKTNGQYWNPFIDDGDALRLAVKLGMNVYTGHGCSMAEVLYNAERDYKSASENHDNDPYAATRRAIVRAAAEIGKALK